METKIELLTNVLPHIEVLKSSFSEIFDHTCILTDKQRKFIDSTVNRKKNKFQKHLNSNIFAEKKKKYEKLLDSIKSYEKDFPKRKFGSRNLCLNM